MGKKYCFILWFAGLFIFFSHFSGISIASQVKGSIFNFQTMNLDASGYGTTVTNLLNNDLASEPTFFILDRKELESFLSRNELQQNDNLENAINIGTHLGLNFIVVGSVEKKDDSLLTSCKVVSIDQKKEVFSQQTRSLGDAGLSSEINTLAKAIRAAIVGLSTKREEPPVFEAPVNLQKRPGNRRVYICWEDAPNTVPVAYEIFRATSLAGPFARLTQVSRREFFDQNLENNVEYYYKVRAYNSNGMPSVFSECISAETALTPNPPVILKTGSFIKSIQLVLVPSPVVSNDPARLIGYKLYRSKEVDGTYKEVANILAKDQNIDEDTGTAPDKLVKVTYLDKGLADGETYYYKLTAYNEKFLESEFSSVIKSSTMLPVSRASKR